MMSNPPLPHTHTEMVEPFLSSYYPCINGTEMAHDGTTPLLWPYVALLSLFSYRTPLPPLSSRVSELSQERNRDAVWIKILWQNYKWRSAPVLPPPPSS